MTKKSAPASDAVTEIEHNDAIAAAYFAPDYVELKPGIKLYRPKVAHQWVFGIVQTDPRYTEILNNPTEFTILMAYLLHFEQDKVRNIIVREARTGVIIDNAWKWIVKNDLSPMDIGPAVTELARDFQSGDDEPGEDQTSGGGAG